MTSILTSGSVTRNWTKRGIHRTERACFGILLGFMLNKHGTVDTIFLLCGDSLPESDTCDDACGRAGGRKEEES